LNTSCKTASANSKVELLYFICEEYQSPALSFQLRVGIDFEIIYLCYDAKPSKTGKSVSCICKLVDMLVSLVHIYMWHE